MVLVQEVLALLADYGYESIEEVETAKENILFSPAQGAACRPEK